MPQAVFAKDPINTTFFGNKAISGHELAGGSEIARTSVS